MAFRSGSSRVGFKVTAYCSNVRHLASRVRAFSTQVHQEQPIIIYVNNDNERKNKLLGPNKKFPFSGDVTARLVYDHEKSEKEAATLPDLKIPKASLSEIFEKSVNELKRAPSSGSVDGDVAESTSGPRNVELAALECPRLLKKDMKELFHDIDFSNRHVTVLNMTQKTKTDMSAWSVEMELERMQLTSGFIESAVAICNTLHSFGYWADFIDPASGRPYLGKFSNATLFDTDERYQSLGFKITDLGCCKILEHVLWGTNAFVGTIFTDAPTNSPAVVEILAKVNSD